MDEGYSIFYVALLRSLWRPYFLGKERGLTVASEMLLGIYFQDVVLCSLPPTAFAIYFEFFVRFLLRLMGDNGHLSFALNTKLFHLCC